MYIRTLGHLERGLSPVPVLYLPIRVIADCTSERDRFDLHHNHKSDRWTSESQTHDLQVICSTLRRRVQEIAAPLVVYILAPPALHHAHQCSTQRTYTAQRLLETSRHYAVVGPNRPVGGPEAASGVPRENGFTSRSSRVRYRGRHPFQP